MYFNRSSKLHFNHLTAKKRRDIESIIAEYSKICNLFISLYEGEIIYSDKPKSKIDYCYASYVQSLKSISKTWISARLIKDAISEAYGMLKSSRALFIKTGKYRKPIHKGKRITLSQTVVKIDENPNTSYFDIMVTLLSIGGKKRINIPLKKHKQFNRWRSEGMLSKTIRLSKSYAQLSFKVEVDNKKLEGDILGIDVGINKLITTSEGCFLGEGYKELLIKLKRKKTYSKGYYRVKNEIKHFVAKSCKDIPWDRISTICTENLKGLKYKTKVNGRLTKNTRYFVYNWNYRELLRRIKMLSEENRVSFRSVPSNFTSQECPVCNHIDKRNRLSQESFICMKCGYSNNADVVGAINVLNRHLTGVYSPCCKSK